MYSAFERCIVFDTWGVELCLTYFICCTRSYVGCSKSCEGYVSHSFLPCSHFFFYKSIQHALFHHCFTLFDFMMAIGAV